MIRSMSLFQHDIVIIGGGGAGLRAAIAVAEVDPSLDVAVVSKVYPMRSHTVAAEGGMAGVIKEDGQLRASHLRPPSVVPTGWPIRTRWEAFVRRGSGGS